MPLRLQHRRWLRPVCLLVALPGCGSNPADAPLMDSRIVLDEKDHVPDLVCPGALGCEVSEGPLRVGAGRRTVTPEVETWDDLDMNGRHDEGEPFEDLDGDESWDGVWLAGFGPGRAATGIHDDLWASALTFSRGDTRIALVVVDSVGLFHQDVTRLREAAQELEIDHLIVQATHDHEAKDTQGLWGARALESGYDPDYMAFLRSRAVEALSEAVANERVSEVAVATATTSSLVADSRQPEVIDPTIYAVSFSEPDKGPFATLTVFGNHPETLSDENTLVSSDYPHFLRTRMEQLFPGSMAVFSPGLLGGLMNPLHIVGCPDAEGRATCRNGTFEKAEYLGVAVANLAHRALSSPTAGAGSSELRLRRKSFFIAPTNARLFIAFQVGLVERPIFDEAGRRLTATQLASTRIEALDRGAFTVHTEVDALTLGPVEFLTIPGELYPELWLSRTDGSSYVERPEGADRPAAPVGRPFSSFGTPGKLVVPLNEGNDALGYIIPESQYDEIAPFAYEAEGQYGEENSLGYRTAGAIEKALSELSSLEAR